MKNQKIAIDNRLRILGTFFFIKLCTIIPNSKEVYELITWPSALSFTTFFFSSFTCNYLSSC